MSLGSSEAMKAGVLSDEHAPAVVTPQHRDVSPETSLLPFVGAKSSRTLEFLTCEYARASSKDFRGAESMNVSVGRTLGRGSFAEVKGAYCHTRKRLMALKIVNKRLASKDYLSHCLPREIELLQRLLSHPYIVTTHSIVETERKVFILMDLAENGDLLDYIGDRVRLLESEARWLFLQFTEGVQYLHTLGIAHRDLKCDNLLLDRNMNLKIADFGFAIDVSVHCITTACGSYAYAAPELFSRSNGWYDALKADVWSMGVVLFAMVSGGLMFGDDETAMRSQNDRRVNFPFGLFLSEALKDLVRRTLRIDPADRLTCQELTQHNWMTRAPPVKPPPPRKSANRYTRANLGIRQDTPNLHHHQHQNQYQYRLVRSSSCVLSGDSACAGGSSRYFVPGPLHYPQVNSRPSKFFRRMVSKISSAVKSKNA